MHLILGKTRDYTCNCPLDVSINNSLTSSEHHHIRFDSTGQNINPEHLLFNSFYFRLEAISKLYVPRIIHTISSQHVSKYTQSLMWMNTRPESLSYCKSVIALCVNNTCSLKWVKILQIHVQPCIIIKTTTTSYIDGNMFIFSAKRRFILMSRSSVGCQFII